MLLRHGGKDARVTGIRHGLAHAQDELQRKERGICRREAEKRHGERPQQVSAHQAPSPPNIDPSTSRRYRGAAQLRRSRKMPRAVRPRAATKTRTPAEEAAWPARGCRDRRNSPERKRRGDQRRSIPCATFRRDAEPLQPSSPRSLRKSYHARHRVRLMPGGLARPRKRRRKRPFARPQKRTAMLSSIGAPDGGTRSLRFDRNHPQIGVAQVVAGMRLPQPPRRPRPSSEWRVGLVPSGSTCSSCAPFRQTTTRA